MNVIRATIPIGLGDLIYIKGILDTVKDRYVQIRLNLHREIINSYDISPEYNTFLDEISALFFSESPYILLQKPESDFYGLVSLCNDNGITPIKPNLAHLLCKGEPLQLDREYIVLNTKVRYLDRNYLDEHIVEFWTYLNELGDKYKIVVLGEKTVEMHRGYQEIGPTHVYSIYDSICHNIPKDRIVDLTVPALGQTSPQLSKIQQDCLIMNKSKLTVTFGIGGGFCMATAVANTLGFRHDDDPIADIVFDGKIYNDAVVTKDWKTFMHAIRIYL